MSFTFPLGLLGLLAVPAIIVIYILQSKYTEQTVPSTYLWHLSEKFLKRKNPLSGLTGIISLILQLLTVIAISLIIAHPVFTLPNAANNYCFVLDASGSMNMTEGRKTRFEQAQDAIADVIRSSKDGSSYSLICVSDETVRVFENVRDKKTAMELLRSTECTHTSAPYANTLRAAQRAFDNDRSTLIYLISDKGYETHENIEIIDVGDETVGNYALTATAYSHVGGKLNVEATVISYVSDASLTLRLYVDGEALDDKQISVTAGNESTVTLEAACTAFQSFRTEIVTVDGYLHDNTISTYNLKSDKTYSTLIVSETGFFFSSVIDALVDSEIRTVSPEEYERVTETYGLYIFDSYVPTELPDATVWLINADKSIENAGFGVRGKISLGTAEPIEKSKSTATNVRALLKGVEGTNIYVSNYVKYSGMYLNFATLFSYDSNPLIFVGSNGLGNRQVVFGFDLHESDFALSTDFVILMRNLLEYSFPDVISSTNHTVGEEVAVNLIANAENLKAISPSGKDIYMESDGSTATLALTEVGTYTISLYVGSIESKYYVYASAHPDESQPTVNEPDFSLAGEQLDANIDGTYDPLVALFICLALLFIADWGVYCYEKYQLR